jgi:hypothetical protein
VGAIQRGLPVERPRAIDGIPLGERRIEFLLDDVRYRDRDFLLILRWYGFDPETQQPVDPANFGDYLDGKRRAYVIVGGKH